MLQEVPTYYYWYDGQPPVIVRVLIGGRLAWMQYFMDSYRCDFILELREIHGIVRYCVVSHWKWRYVEPYMNKS